MAVGSIEQEFSYDEMGFVLMPDASYFKVSKSKGCF